MTENSWGNMVRGGRKWLKSVGLLGLEGKKSWEEFIYLTYVKRFHCFKKNLWLHWLRLDIVLLTVNEIGGAPIGPLMQEYLLSSRAAHWDYVNETPDHDIAAEMRMGLRKIDDSWLLGTSWAPWWGTFLSCGLTLLNWAKVSNDWLKNCCIYHSGQV